MASYVSLLQFTDQGARSVKESPKRAAAATAAAEKMGVRIHDIFWTVGAYDLVITSEAPDDETMSAFALSLGALGNVRTQTLRAYRAKEFEGILGKIR